MASIAEVKADIVEVAQQVADAADRIRAAAYEADVALTRLRTCFGGAQNARVLQAFAQAEQQRAHLTEASALADQSAAAMREYLTILG